MSIARRWLVFLFICSYVSFAGAQPEPIKLWPKGAPGAEGSFTPETVRLNPDGEHVISNTVSGWTTLFLDWMNAQGLLKH